MAPILIIFANSFLVGFSGAVSPGPLLAFNIKETVRIGFIAGPLVVAGHSLLELVTVGALAFGLAPRTLFATDTVFGGKVSRTAGRRLPCMDDLGAVEKSV